MASGLDVTVDFPDLKAIKEAFRTLPSKIAAKYMGAALGKAIDPGLKTLRSLTPRGPTGNLRRSIRKKTKKYTRTGSAVALAGYTAAPKGKSSDAKSNQKGHHQGFLEFGTKERITKGNIASSFGRSGPIKAIFGKRSGKATSKPRPPKGFIKVAKKGETVDLGTFPIGGKGGVPPVKTAFERSLSSIKSNMTKDMTLALNNALKEMASPFRRGRQ